MNPYEVAEKEIGTVEWRNGDNPKIVAYFRDAGHAWVKDDETAWCAAFACAMIERAGYDSPKKLNARSFLEWGEPVSLAGAKKGDVVVFSRGEPWQGHVGFYDHHGDNYVTVLGGNQSNEVRLSAYDKSRMLGVRRGPWGVENDSRFSLVAALIGIFRAIIGGGK